MKVEMTLLISGEVAKNVFNQEEVEIKFGKICINPTQSIHAIEFKA